MLFSTNLAGSRMVVVWGETRPPARWASRILYMGTGYKFFLVPIQMFVMY